VRFWAAAQPFRNRRQFLKDFAATSAVAAGLEASRDAIFAAAQIKPDLFRSN
jgi:hypothetical protein